MACCGGGEPSPANTPNRQQVSEMQSRLGAMQNPVCIKLVKPNCIRFTQYGPVTHREYLVTSGQSLLVDERDAPQMLGQIDRGQHLYVVSDECVDQDDPDEEPSTADDSADENSATENVSSNEEPPTADDSADDNSATESVGSDEAPSTGSRGGKGKKQGN